MKCPHCGRETEEKSKERVDVGFEEFRKVYPRRCGGQRWPEARRNFVRLLRDERLAPIDLIVCASRYKRFCLLQHTVGTEYVMQAATFLGRGGGYLEDWSTETRFDTARRQLQEQP